MDGFFLFFGIGASAAVVYLVFRCGIPLLYMVADCLVTGVRVAVTSFLDGCRTPRRS
jgi:hypothetical protein